MIRLKMKTGSILWNYFCTYCINKILVIGLNDKKSELFLMAQTRNLNVYTNTKQLLSRK
ncbi:hypothetical protein IGJ55_001106 [Enterococcus sp. AZ170]